MKIFKKNREGFSLVEVLVGVALVAIALLGLAQLFVLSIMQNARSDRMTNASFLVQQQIEQLRTLTAGELNLLTAGEVDELLDINQDAINDFRRITQVRFVNESYEVRVLVFYGEHAGLGTADLLANPVQYKVTTDISTKIGR